MRELKKENTILSSPVKYSKEGVSAEIKQMVINFYESEEVSRMCPAKKDYISVKIPNRKNEKILRRLKSENPDLHISTVAFLRPKWSIPVGSRGSHNVCVCTYYQNIKLMLSILDHTLDYMEVLKLCVCNITWHKYMLSHCDNCPEQFVIQDFLTVQCLKTYDRQFH